METKKIDLSEAARLQRVLSGKEKPASGMDRKLAEMQERAEKQEKEQQAKEKAKNAVQQPAFTNKDRLNAVRRTLKIKGIQQDPGLEDKIFLFSLSGKFFFAKKGIEFKKITEADVNPTLNDNKEAELYYICTGSGRMCPLPKSFVGRKATAKMVKDNQGAADFITELTGIKVTTSML